MKLDIFENKENLAYGLGLGHFKHPPIMVPNGQTIDQGSHLSPGLARGTARARPARTGAGRGRLPVVSARPGLLQGLST